MTGTATRVRHLKTNPECRGDRHRPEHKSFAKGCTCPETLAAEERYRATYEQTQRGMAGVIPQGDDTRCPGSRHTATNNSWKLGCRHEGAVRAHNEWKAAIVRQRAATLEHHHRTGECIARTHDTMYAYASNGCRCPLAVKLNQARAARQPKRKRIRNDAYRTIHLTVGRSSLMMLMAGCPDDPTPGEIMAADIRLQRVRVPNGPVRWRSLTVLEIAERLGTNDQAIYRMRRERERLREARPQRRLAEVRAKAERVARATGRAA